MVNKALLYIWNVLVLVGLAAALRYGFIDATQANDVTGITWLIVSVFAMSQVVAWWPIPKEKLIGDGELRLVAGGMPWQRSSILYDSCTVMVMMGLMGTIVGFMDALETVQATGDTSGISTALWTTLVGLVGSLINFVTHRLMGGSKG